MVRRPRPLAPGLLYHVIARGNQRQKTFLDLGFLGSGLTIDLLWADLIRRAFDLDALACPRCGGRMGLLATIRPQGFA